MRTFSLCAMALTAMLGTALPAAAEDAYPNRPIKILVPIPPGGAPDVVARLVGNYLSGAPPGGIGTRILIGRFG